MKIKLSWYFSEQENHTSEWDIPWADVWSIRKAIDDHIELRRLAVENRDLKSRLELVEKKNV